MHFEDLPFPSIGLGLAALGRPGYINLSHDDDLGPDKSMTALEQHTHNMLDLAYACGIRYIDAARSYGYAEKFLASWIEKRKGVATEISVGSKWGYTYTADWRVDAAQHEVKEHSLDRLNRQWEISSGLLPDLQLYQIHSATFSSGIIENEAVLQRLSELKETHGIKIGLSTSGAQQAVFLQKAMETSLKYGQLFDTFQSTYNILEPSAGPQLQLAHELGMRIIVKEAVANGRLTLSNDPSQISPVMLQLAQKHGVGVDAIALAYVLAQPWVDIVLSGAATVEHLQANLLARKVTLGEEELMQLASSREAPEVYWQTRSQLAWN